MACNVTIGGCAGTNFIPPLVSDTMFTYFRIINWFVLIFVINAFGIVSNAINMVVVYKMGFDENNKINVSLFALAISDFGSCATVIWLSVTMNPWIRKLDLNFYPDEVSYLYGGWPHVMFTKITTMIIAFITFERCLCVCLPLKVKHIVTKGRTLCFLVFSYVLNIALMVPIFYSTRLGWRQDVKLNKTMFGLTFTHNREEIESVVYPIINAFISMFGFILIIISTTLLVTKLREKSKWRMQAASAQVVTSDTKGEGNSNKSTISKDEKVSRTVVFISVLFIVCFLPTVGMQISMWLDRRIAEDGAYRKLNKVMASCTFVLESVNAAMNIIIYYKTSSNYRTVFDQMFRSKKKDNHLLKGAGKE